MSKAMLGARLLAPAVGEQVVPTVAWMPASWFRCRLCGEEPTSTWGPRNGCPHEWMMVGGPTLQAALVEAGQGQLWQGGEQ